MDDLNSFVQQRRGIGESDQDIASELLGAGWDREAVKASLQSIYSAPTPVTTPTPAPVNSTLAVGRTRSRKSNKVLFAVLGVAILLVIGLVGFLIFGKTSGSSTTKNENRLVDTSEVAAKRDTQRKGDVGRLLVEAEIQNTADGRYPSSDDDGWAVLTGNFKNFDDPLADKSYVFTPGEPKAGEIQYANRVVCNEDKLAVGNARSIVFRVLLESGELYCQDNL